MRASHHCPAAFKRSLVWICLAAACGADPPKFNDRPDAGGSGNQGGGIKLNPPAAAGPETTPRDSAALRGTAPGGSTVVVQTGGARNVVARVLPDGSFCVDVPLEIGANTLRVTSLAQGSKSQEATVVVVRDPNATVPASPTCAPPPQPPGSCNDAQAMCDPACNGCAEDAYQPNFAAGQAPALGMKRSYQRLQLCPCNTDWYTFVAHAGQAIGITATYAKASGFDLDIALFRGGDVLPTMDTGATAVATSASGTSGSNATRTITFTPTIGGAYYLRVAAPTGTSGRGGYQPDGQMRRARSSSLWLSLLLLPLGGCGGEERPCSTSAGCEATEVCLPAVTAATATGTAGAS